MVIFALTLLGVSDEIFVRCFVSKRGAQAWLSKNGFMQKVNGEYVDVAEMPDGFYGYRIDED